jgi:hypothetical protein
MKLNVPVLVGAAVVAAGLAVLVLWQPEKAEEIAAVSLARIQADLREGAASRGATSSSKRPPSQPRRRRMIVRLEISSPTASPPAVPPAAARRKGWEFDRDLGRSFGEFAKAEKATSQRLGKRLAERYQEAVNIPAENVRIAQRIRESTAPGSTDVRIVGSIEIRFRDGGGEGRYIEDFTFANGTWTMEGQGGALYDKGPSSK